MVALRWGFLGNARHAVDAMLPALAATRSGRAVAIASRDSSGASATARRFGIDRVHADYSALLADPEVDAVYIGLPNSLHAEWIRRSIEAGKHVLCEKPFTLTAAETAGLADAAAVRGVHVQEALMTWSHPRWHEIRDVIRAGRIGTLSAVQGRFCYFTRDTGNIRTQADMGGGALLDIGSYLVSSARFVLEAEPVRAAAVIDVDPDFGVDRHCSFLLDFPNAQGSFVCSSQTAHTQTMTFFGTRGRIEVGMPFTPPASAPSTYLIAASESDVAPPIEEIVTVPAVDQYRCELDDFAGLVAGDRGPAVPFESSVRNLKVLDAIRAAGKSATWEPV